MHHDDDPVSIAGQLRTLRGNQNRFLQSIAVMLEQAQEAIEMGKPEYAAQIIGNLRTDITGQVKDNMP
jgi:hypothetical protein